MWKRILALAATAAACATLAAAQSPFYLKNGDRVVFYGDSITEQRLYTNDIEDFVLTRLPHLQVTFTNSGVGGDKVSGGWAGPIDTRLPRDVYPYRPTVVTIMLGMNDGLYRPLTPEIDDNYTAGYRHILAELKAHDPDARMTLIEPSPYDDVTRAPKFTGGYNASMLQFSKFIAELGAQDHSTVADFNTPMVAMLRRAGDRDAALAQKIIPDRIHPGAAGHWVMAEALLKTWGATPLVSAVSLDAAQGSTTDQKDASVSSIEKTSGGLRWTEQEEALPLPLKLQDPLMQLVMNSSDLVQSLDQETLQVTGLDEGSYRLSIDGKEAGSFSATALAHGINLAVLPTPMLDQALDVDRLTHAHNELRYAAWRSIDIPLAKDDLSGKAAADQALATLEQQVVAERQQMAQPKPHQFQLVRE